MLEMFEQELKVRSAWPEKVNPEKNKEPCLSFVEKTNSEVCAIVKKQIVKEK